MSDLDPTSGLTGTHSFRQLIEQLQRSRQEHSADRWPHHELECLGAAGGWRWNISLEMGGDGCSAEELLFAYRKLAEVSLVTSFVLTQRNAACQRIENSSNGVARSRWLPRLASGELFATVGISHLTTSRQHLAAPPVSAILDPRNGDLTLNGVVPWATGATRAELLVTGGTMADGRQVLAAVESTALGLKVGEPVSMLALSESDTGSFELNHVRLDQSAILHGPVEQVMVRSAGGGAGSLATSALALGAAAGNLRGCHEELTHRTAQRTYMEPLEAELHSLTAALHAAAPPVKSDELRRRANLLAIRSAQFWLAVTKGAGFVTGHPAEKAVRESLFFLVWSCPQPVVDATLQELSCRLD